MKKLRKIVVQMKRTIALLGKVERNLAAMEQVLRAIAEGRGARHRKEAK